MRGIGFDGGGFRKKIVGPPAPPPTMGNSVSADVDSDAM